jgi:hypothetical protein
MSYFLETAPVYPSDIHGFQSIVLNSAHHPVIGTRAPESTMPWLDTHNFGRPCNVKLYNSPLLLFLAELWVFFTSNIFALIATYRIGTYRKYPTLAHNPIHTRVSYQYQRYYQPEVSWLHRRELSCLFLSSTDVIHTSLHAWTIHSAHRCR